MDLGSLLSILGTLASWLVIGGIVYVFRRLSRERAVNSLLREDTGEWVCFETALDRVSVLGTGGFGGTRGQWLMKRPPRRLIVGTDAFVVASSLREEIFIGSESSIAFSQEPSRLATRDWIIISGHNGTRQVQLAVSRKDAMPEIWQALAGTGAALDSRDLPKLVLREVAATPAARTP
jgi:hypothetical protein